MVHQVEHGEGLAAHTTSSDDSVCNESATSITTHTDESFAQQWHASSSTSASTAQMHVDLLHLAAWTSSMSHQHSTLPLQTPTTAAQISVGTAHKSYQHPYTSAATAYIIDVMYCSDVTGEDNLIPYDVVSYNHLPRNHLPHNSTTTSTSLSPPGPTAWRDHIPEQFWTSCQPNNLVNQSESMASNQSDVGKQEPPSSTTYNLTHHALNDGSQVQVHKGIIAGIRD